MIIRRFISKLGPFKLDHLTYEYETYEMENGKRMTLTQRFSSSISSLQWSLFTHLQTHSSCSNVFVPPPTLQNDSPSFKFVR